MGDTILLCSDGLTNMLTDRRMLEIIAGHGSDLEGAYEGLLAEATPRAGGITSARSSCVEPVEKPS